MRISEAGPDTIRISVRDHGVGIPPEHRDHIFERYYQANTGIRSGGMGLGLNISQYIIDLHGGEISTEFPQDGGTTFVVTLPRGVDRR